VTEIEAVLADCAVVPGLPRSKSFVEMQIPGDNWRAFIDIGKRAGAPLFYRAVSGFYETVEEMFDLTIDDVDKILTAAVEDDRARMVDLAWFSGPVLHRWHAEADWYSEAFNRLYEVAQAAGGTYEEQALNDIEEVARTLAARWEWINEMPQRRHRLLMGSRKVELGLESASYEVVDQLGERAGELADQSIERWRAEVEPRLPELATLLAHDAVFCDTSKADHRDRLARDWLKEREGFLDSRIASRLRKRADPLRKLREPQSSLLAGQ
jgi:hypothetical protein